MAWNWDGKRLRIGNVYLFAESKDYSCQNTWTTSKMARGKQNLCPMWKKLMKLVDLGKIKEETLFGSISETSSTKMRDG